MDSSLQIDLKKVQDQYHERPLHITIGMMYSFIFLLKAGVFSIFAILSDGNLPMPFLIYLMGLFFAEKLMSESLNERIRQSAPKSISSKKIEINWPMNSSTYVSIAWIIFDLLLDYLILNWALTSNSNHNLFIGLFLGSKSVGFFFMCVWNHYQRVDSQLWTSFLFTCLGAYYVIVLAKMNPLTQIIIVVIVMKGLFANFLILSRIKLAQNSEIKIVE